MGELVREAMTGDRPLCPRSYAGKTIEHLTDVQIENRIYETLKPYRTGEDDELPADLETVFHKYNEGTAYMQLHTESSQFLYHGDIIRVEAWFWLCHLCGCVIPATATNAFPRSAL